MTSLRAAEMEAAAEFHAHEMAVDTAGDRAWERWLKRVEVASCIANLDGDGKEDGYSLDELYDWYCAGWSSDRAARAIEKYAPGRED